MPNPTITVEISSVEAKRGAEEVRNELREISRVAETLKRDLSGIDQIFVDMRKSGGAIQGTTAALTQQARATEAVGEATKRSAGNQVAANNAVGKSLDKEAKEFINLQKKISIARRAAIEFKDAETILARELNKNTINQQLHNTMLGEAKIRFSKAGVAASSYKTSFAELTKVAQIALGPLSGVASRISAFSSLTSQAGARLAAGLSLGVGVGALAVQALKASEALDKLIKKSDQLAVSVEFLQELKFVGLRQGVDNVDRALEIFSKRLGEAKTGSGEAKNAFIKLGLSMELLASINTEQAFKRVIAGFGNIKEGADRNIIAADLFSRRFQNMVKVLGLGPEGFRELTEEANKLGLIIGTDAARDAEKLQDSMTNLKATFTAVSQRIASAFFPVMKQTVDFFLGAGLAAANFVDTVSQIEDMTLIGLGTEIDEIRGRIEKLTEARIKLRVSGQDTTRTGIAGFFEGVDERIEFQESRIGDRQIFEEISRVVADRDLEMMNKLLAELETRKQRVDAEVGDVGAWDRWIQEMGFAGSAVVSLLNRQDALTEGTSKLREHVEALARTAGAGAFPVDAQAAEAATKSIEDLNQELEDLVKIQAALQRGGIDAGRVAKAALEVDQTLDALGFSDAIRLAKKDTGNFITFVQNNFPELAQEMRKAFIESGVAAEDFRDHLIQQAVKAEVLKIAIEDLKSEYKNLESAVKRANKAFDDAGAKSAINVRNIREEIAAKRAQIGALESGAPASIFDTKVLAEQEKILRKLTAHLEKAGRLTRPLDKETKEIVDEYKALANALGRVNVELTEAKKKQKDIADAAKQRKEDVIDLKLETEQLKAQAEAIRSGAAATREYTIETRAHNKALEIINQSVEKGTLTAAEYIKEFERIKEITREWSEAVDEVERLEASVTQLGTAMQEAALEAVRGIQSAFAGQIKSLLDGEIKSFKDFGDAVFDILKTSIAEGIAAALTQGLVTQVTQFIQSDDFLDLFGLGGSKTATPSTTAGAGAAGPAGGLKEAIEENTVAEKESTSVARDSTEATIEATKEAIDNLDTLSQGTEDQQKVAIIADNSDAVRGLTTEIVRLSNLIGQQIQVANKLVRCCGELKEVVSSLMNSVDSLSERLSDCCPGGKIIEPPETGDLIVREGEDPNAPINTADIAQAQEIITGLEGLTGAVDNNTSATVDSTTAIVKGATSAGGAGGGGGVGGVVGGGLTGSLGSIGGGLAGIAVGTGLTSVLIDDSSTVQIASAIGGVVGAAVGSIIPGLGTFLGGLIGSVIVGAFAKGISDLVKGESFAGRSTTEIVLLSIPYVDIIFLLLESFGIFTPKNKTFQLKTVAAEDDREARATGAFRGKAVLETEFGFIGADIENTKRLKDEFTAQLIQFIKEVDRQLALILRIEDIPIAAEALQATEAIQTSFKDFDTELFHTAADRIDTILKALTDDAAAVDAFLGVTIEGIDKKGKPEAVQELIEAVTPFIEEITAIKDMTESLEQLASGVAVSSITKQIDEINELAREITLRSPVVGLDTAGIETLRLQALDQIRIKFNEDIAQQILEIESPLDAAFAAQDLIQEQRIRDAIAAGADLVEVERLGMLERQDIVERFTQQITNMLEDLLAGPASPLAPGTVLANAEAAFEEVKAGLLAGDTSQLELLPDAAQNFLDASREMFASSAAFFENFDLVVSTLEMFSDFTPPEDDPIRNLNHTMEEGNREDLRFYEDSRRFHERWLSGDDSRRTSSERMAAANDENGLGPRVGRGVA